MAKTKQNPSPEPSESQASSDEAYSESQAKEDGWVIAHEQEPTVVSASGRGATTELVVAPGKYIAEKTFDGHLITAVAETKDALIEAIRSQQASIDSAPASTRPLGPHDSDMPGGEEGGGMGEALPETKVQLTDEGEVQEVSA